MITGEGEPRLKTPVAMKKVSFLLSYWPYSDVR